MRLKILTILGLLSIYSCSSQFNLNQDQRTVLELELQKKQNSHGAIREVGDSLIVAAEILPYSKNLDELKSWVIEARCLSKADAEEIFGPDPVKSFSSVMVNRKWTHKDFPRRVVTFYDDERKNRQSLSIFNIFSFSVPIIRNDMKYILLQTSDNHNGGVLHIYKHSDDGWVLYKDVQLYLI
jgi:hypothetical protein